MGRAIARPLACDWVPGHSAWEAKDVRTQCYHVDPVLEQVAELHFSDLPPILNFAFGFIWIQTEVPKLGI